MLFFFLFSVSSSQSYATTKTENTSKKNTPNIEVFADSQSYSDILPVKQLIEDDWQQAPLNSASNGFTQNEVGVRAYWNNLSVSLSQRYDYFIYSNSDTAKAFYLEREDLALNTQESYDIDLKLFHQRSNGIRIGYNLQFENISIDTRLGYWKLDATRESYLTGTLSSDLAGNISGFAELREMYSHDNFLKRSNANNDWDSDGDGITLDIHMKWQPTKNWLITADLKDLYSDFTLDNTGYSTGSANTNGTYINSVGGIAYLPLYQGRETKTKHNFELPKHIDVATLYNYEGNNYIARVKRQGDHNFYYLGFGFQGDNSSTRLLFDIENKAPEIQYTHSWFSFALSIDDIDINQAHLFNISLAAHYTF